MTVCTTPFDAAQRFIRQLKDLDAAGFESSLDREVEHHGARLNGPHKIDRPVNRGAAAVFAAYKKGLFDTTTNIDVRKWSVECNGLSAVCLSEIDQDKNIPDGLQGRYRFQGNCRFNFVVDPATGDLKIKEIWDGSAVFEL